MVTQREFLEKNSRNYTDDEIIEQAKNLGMIFPTDSNDNDINETIINEDDQIIEEDVIVRINYGMTSQEVSNLLFEKGIIEDSEDFHWYIIQQNLTKKIVAGRYPLNINLDYDTILEMITK
ncbi:hypothetical protein EDC18_104221 [Natranaerovirga pectinivora]|uniref:YceG-like family protein n=1 Tax=Natranaerovirga pectinivora TaxID=682400 RepID=A0A4V2V0B4_9FIRM|nr:hypothetical protein [Natranaerovirga pectinivora]TCT15071.1 hypothetical protein EDC18_104221 [Natranaerovirga pectinivora]